jgi:hypothetical protein
MRAPRFLVVAALLLLPAPALAGMPTPVVTDVVRTFQLTESAESRLRAISLFLVVLMLCPLVVRWLWNSLCRDFPRWPRITYGKAFGLVALWGLLFLVVLTMIAATREAMTPGSWQKQGLLYRVADAPPASPDPKPSEKSP